MDLDLGLNSAKDMESSEPVITPAKAGKKGAKATTVTEQKKLFVPELTLSHIIIPIVGKTQLIVNNFSAKSRKQMLDKQMGIAQNKREKKVPTDDFLGSLYVIGDKKPKLVEKGDRVYAEGFTAGFPANALKNVAVAACAAIQGVFKTEARMAFFVEGYTLPVLDPKTGKPAIPFMREDIVRLAGPRPVADIRFRACFDEWMILIPIEFNTRMIDEARLVHLYNNAGFGVGIGEWRPECDGPHGRFEVDLSKQKMFNKKMAA